MTGREEGVGTTGPQRRSRRSPKSMRVVKRNRSESEGRRADRLDRGAEVEARESDISYLSRTVLLDKYVSVEEELNKTKKYHYSWTASLQLTQNKLQRVRGGME